MYKILKSIFSINPSAQPYFGLEYMIISKKKSLFIFDKNSLKLVSEIKLEFLINNIYEYNNSLIITNENNEPFKLQNITVSNYLLEQLSKCPINIKKGFNIRAGLYLFEIFECYYPIIIKKGVFSLEENKVLWESKNFGNGYFIENFLLCLEAKGLELLRINPDDGKKIWKFDFSNFTKYKEHSTNQDCQTGQLQRFLGIYKNNLLIATTNQTILSINIITGKLIKKWRELPQNTKWGSQNSELLPYPKQSILLKEEGKIIGLLYTYYWEIDLKTEEVHFHDATEAFQKYKTQTVTGGEISHQGDYIFFCGDKNSIGAFNRKTKVLDWFYQFDFDAETFITSYAPKVEGNRLFVMDNKGTLYIFEKIQTKDL